MNKIEKGKKQLKWLGIGVLILSSLLAVASIICFIVGAKRAVSSSFNYLFVLGIVFAILALIGIIVSIYFIWLSAAVVATHGSIAEDNLGVGTVNMIKCNKCGEEVKEGEIFCGKCGAKLSESKICSSCGKENKADNKHCSTCGKEF